MEPNRISARSFRSCKLIINNFRQINIRLTTKRKASLLPGAWSRRNEQGHTDVINKINLLAPCHIFVGFYKNADKLCYKYNSSEKSLPFFS